MLHRHTLFLIRPKVSSFIWFLILFACFLCFVCITCMKFAGHESRNDESIDNKKEIKVEMHTFRTIDFLKWIRE